jgi:imidazolonepropionase-like amidohydrolase
MKSDADSGKQNILITNARLIDGLGSVHHDLQSIYIQEGKIAEIAQDIPINDVRRLDVGGATVMPGLIDAHVHLQSVPGSVFRKDSEEKLEKYRYHQLRAYLACGVTTILDNAIAASMLRKFQKHLSSGGIGPRLYALAPAFYTPNGFLDNDMLTSYWGPQWRSAGSRENIEALFEEYEGIENIVGVKTMLESGFGKSHLWPLHPPEIRKIIVSEAAKRNLPIYIHAFKKKEQEIGLDMGVHNFVHSGFIFGQPSNHFINRMLKKGAYLTTTLSCTLDQMLVQFEPARLHNDLLKLTVPEELLMTARNPEAWKDYYNTFIKNSSPKWMPSFFLKMIIKLINIEKSIRTGLANATKAVVTMHKAGIPIVVGTDASNWPAFLTFFHGPSTIREIELLGNGGIPPMDVILSATRISAEMMGLQNLIGTVEVGKLADLIVVRDDPLKDLSALRSVMWTVKDGEARTPEEWMEYDHL